MLSKNSKKAIFEGVENIINKSFGIYKNISLDKFFNISSNINYLLENCGSDKNLVQFLVEYKNLADTTNEIFLLESFIEGLGNYTANAKVNKVRNSLIESVDKNREQLQLAYLYESIQDEGVQEVLKTAYSSYLNESSDVNRNNLRSILESVSGIGNPLIDRMYNIVNKNINTNAKSGCLFESVSYNTAKNQNVDIEELKENINNFITEKLKECALKEDDIEECGVEECGVSEDDMEECGDGNCDPDENKLEEHRYTLNDIANKNGINLLESVVRLKKKTNNEKLHNILDEYYNALVNNAYEERLYETFYSNLSNFSYLLPVETEMSAINKRVNAAKQNIDLTKILEMMQATTSYYLVPLIEHQVIDYMKAKTPNKKQALLFGLKPYGHDPFVRQIIEIVTLDQDKAANVMAESVLSNTDKRKLVSENASVCNIYSPIQYIKENESVFNIKGIFYQKKGNTITRFDKTKINTLDESFLELCQLVNDPRVKIDNDSIFFESNGKTAVITESSVTINGNIETSKTLRNLNEMYIKYNDYDTEFYIMATCLLENFNNIAQIDFARRVVLNENESYSLDLFNVNSNLFIATHNDAMHSHVFYRNVNPIQCKNIINEHMGLNVSSLFENILPNQSAILENLQETKETYEEKLEELRNMKEELQAKADECEDEDDKKKLEDAVKDCEKDIEDAEKEFKEWQEESDKAVNGDSAQDDSEDDGNDEVNSEDTDSPKEDVTDEDIADYSNPIGDENGNPSEPSDMNFDDEPDFNEDDLGPDDFNTEDGMPDLSMGDENMEEELPGEEDMPDEEFGDEEFAPGEEDVNDDFTEADFANKEDLGDTDDMLDYEDGDDEFEDRFDNAASDILDDFEEPEEPSDEELASINVDTDESKVTGIYFDENVKTGKIMKSGTISVTQPMIDPEGNKYIDTKNIQFYIDDDNRPILNNDEISAEIYNKALTAIESNPKFEEVVKRGVEGRDIANSRQFEDEGFEEDFDIMEPEQTVSDEEISDIEPNFSDSIEIPTYEIDDTEVELPANNIPFEEDLDLGVDKKDVDIISEKKVIGIKANYDKFSINEGKLESNKNSKKYIKL